MGLGILGALIGSLIGAVIWGGIVIATDYEVGYVAIGIGALSGIGASLLGGGGSTTLGVVAAVLSVLGICGGKYIAVVHIMGTYQSVMIAEFESIPDYNALSAEEKKAALAEAEKEFEKTSGVKPSEISYTSFGPVIGIMLDPEMEMFTGMDLLFAVIALAAAWKFASGNREEAG